MPFKCKNGFEYGDMSTRVALDELSDGKIVSTVQLIAPIGDYLYETLVFPEGGDFLDIDGDRYRTYKEAVLGHKLMMTKYMVKKLSENVVFFSKWRKS